MVGYVVTGHAEFAPGLASSLNLLVSSLPDFDAVPYRLGEESSYLQRLTEAVSRVGQDEEGVIIFCDLMGGSPFNQAMALAKQTDGVEVITGANLSMLLAAYNARAEGVTIEEQVATALKAGEDGINNPTAKDDA